MKKIVALLLSVVMILSVFFFCVSADDLTVESETFSSYKAVLNDIYYDKNEKYCNSKCKDHYFGVEDINNDGVLDLLVKFKCNNSVHSSIIVWTYDVVNECVVCLKRYFGESTSFYSTGYAMSPISHNQMNSWPLWPYSIIDNNTGISVYYVESYRNGYEHWWSGDPDDVDYDEITYYVDFTEHSVTMTHEEFIQLEQQYAPEDKLLNIDYELIDSYSISQVDESFISKPTEVKTKKGDVNCDGRITAADARLALQYAARLKTPDEKQHTLADVDESGYITAFDARKILRVAAQLEPPFEDEEVKLSIFDRTSYNGLYFDYAENAISYFDNYQYFVDEDRSGFDTEYIFYTNSYISDFYLYCYDIYDWNNICIKNKYYFGDVTPGCPIVIKVGISDVSIPYSISFVDENGVTYKYSITENYAGDAEHDPVYLF